MVIALKVLKMPLCIGLSNISRENNKTHFDDDILEEELLKYVVLNRKG